MAKVFFSFVCACLNVYEYIWCLDYSVQYWSDTVALLLEKKPYMAWYLTGPDYIQHYQYVYIYIYIYIYIFASQSQTCQLLKIFFFLSGWTDEDQLQIWSSHYSSTNNYLHYLLEVRIRVTSAWSKNNGNIDIFQYSRQVNVATWFLVLPIDTENSYDYREGGYIYNIYVEFLASHFSDLSRCKNLPGGR